MNKMLYLCRPIGYIHSDATKKMERKWVSLTVIR